MNKFIAFFVMAYILCIFPQISFAETLLATGSVESKNTQHILMPMVQSFQGKINDIVTEGKLVKAGDVLVKVDASGVDSQIDNLEEQLELFKANAKKSEIDLAISYNNAKKTFDVAKINYEIAKMKANTPLNFIGELKYKQNQLALKNSEKSFKKAKIDLAETIKKQKEQQIEFKLGLAQKQKKLQHQQELLSLYTITAKQSGYVIYATHPWNGNKIQLGDQVQAGREILSISENSDLQINAWVNAIDIPKISTGNQVKVQFDAFLGKQYAGDIVKIAAGGEDKKVWGDALYYKVVIKLQQQPQEKILAGMSAVLEIEANSHD